MSSTARDARPPGCNDLTVAKTVAVAMAMAMAVAVAMAVA